MVGRVIFDMDGVIFDTERFYLECLKPAAEGLGLENIEEVAFACIGLTETENRKRMLAFYGPDAPIEQLEAEASKNFRARYDAEGLPVKPFVREILDWLREAGIPTALASSTRTDIITRELTDAGLIGYFDAVIGGDQVSKSKPAPDIFLKAAEALDAEDAKDALKAPDAPGEKDALNAPDVPDAPGEKDALNAPDVPDAEDTKSPACFVIEDSYNGIRAASAAGMRPLMVPDLLQPDEEIRQLAEGIFPSLREVLDYLQAEAAFSGESMSHR